jgi:hypothetical protein
MNHEILAFSAALLLGLLWAVFSARLLLRMSGTPASWNLLKSLRARLSGGHHLLLGVLSFGGSLLIFDLADRFILWRLYGIESEQLTPDRFFRVLVGDLFAGFLFGFVTMFTSPKRNSD